MGGLRALGLGDLLRSYADRIKVKPQGAAPAVGRRVAVVTDSAAALPPAWAAEHVASGLLTVVSMPVIIGEHVYSDDDAQLETHIALALAAGTTVSTSRPAPSQFSLAYQKALEAGFDSVVSIHISAKLSGTVDSAQMAADQSALPVLVLDSCTVGMGQGSSVQAAIDASLAGCAIDQVMAVAAKAAESSQLFFYVPSLDQLRRGGRISLASSWFGTVLDIKPLLTIREGAVVPLEKIRTASKALARLEGLAAESVLRRGVESAQVSIHYFGNMDQAKHLTASLKIRCVGLPEPTLTRLPAVLAAHAGLGVLAAVISSTEV